MRITVGYGDPARGQVRKLLREATFSVGKLLNRKLVLALS